MSCCHEQQRIRIAPKHLRLDGDLRLRADRKLNRAIEQTFHQRGAEGSAHPDRHIRMCAAEGLEQPRYEILGARWVRSEREAPQAAVCEPLHLVQSFSAQSLNAFGVRQQRSTRL